jgi:hypothetical protein
MALILAYENENFLKPFVGVLLLLSAIMLGLFIYSVINPKFLAALWYVGDEYDFIVIGTRNYGPLSYKTIFYTTSPSLVIAAAFLSARAIVRVGMARWLSILGAVLVMFAMVISGTRNGIIMALITPCLAFYFFSRNRRAALALVLGISLLVALAAMPILSAMFDPKEGSNSIKLGYLADYASLFSSPTTFFLGQGLGATFYSVVKGKAVAITELTYLEFMRNFGVPLALLYFLMLVYPIRRLWQSQDQSRKSLALGYGLFLVSAAFNPIIVSSLGMLVLSIVLASAFENERQVDRREVQFSLQRARA